MEKMSFSGACHKFFGRKPGQNLTEFQQEMRTCTQQDREELAVMFKSVGFELTRNADGTL